MHPKKMAIKQDLYDVLPHEVMITGDIYAARKWLEDPDVEMVKGVYAGRASVRRDTAYFRFSDADTALVFKLMFGSS